MQLLILEILPSKSVVDLFVASPSFRELGAHLPISFWKSRHAWDIPWTDCPQLWRQFSEAKKPIRYNILLGALKKSSSVKEPDESQELSPFQILGLENRHRIWLNCEFILGKVKEEFSTLWQQAGSLSPIIRKISAYLDTPIKDSEDIEGVDTSDVYFVLDVVMPYFLTNVVAYFGDEIQIIGIESLVDGLMVERTPANCSGTGALRNSRLQLQGNELLGWPFHSIKAQSLPRICQSRGWGSCTGTTHTLLPSASAFQDLSN